MTLQQKINKALNTNQQVIISSFNGVTCHVEKVSKSNKVRFVRTFENGSFEIYQIA